MRYWAFLSYSHADEAAASKLHRALESYTLPAAVRRAHGLPKRLIPVFRDVEELEAAAGLSKRLESALDDSRWLIVLCSPASAQSKYVNDEIKYFLKQHGAEKILCVLLEGDPAQSFPEAIQELDDEPLAADLRSGADFDLAVLKLIAAMATIGFTELRNREAQRKKRQRMLAAASVAALSLGALAYWDLFHREHVEYYVGYVREHGIWHGVDRISAETASRRNENYRFTRRGRLNHPRRVDYINGSRHCPYSGMPGPLGHRRSKGFGFSTTFYCSVEFDYQDDGALARERWLNSQGRALETLTHTEEGLAQFTQKGFASAEGGGGIFYIQSERDERGFDRRILFLHSPGKPRPNDSSEFGLRMDYDLAGRIIRRSVLDDRGAEIGNVQHFRYDANGLPVEKRFTDLAGKPHMTRDGYSTWLGEYDVNGNLVLERFFEPDGSPAIASVQPGNEERNSGFSALVHVWDERGNSTERRRLDAGGNLVNDRLGFAVERMTYDERGNVTSRATFDNLMRPASRSGVATAVHQHDEYNNAIETRAFDEHGRLAGGESGAAVVRVTFNYPEHYFQECYFDENDKPLMIWVGHCMRWTFDERDSHPVEVRFFDPQGGLYTRQDSGFAIARFNRDERGNPVEVSFLNAELEPVLNTRRGWGRVERSYDEYGNAVEVRAFDTLGRLIRNREGVAISRAKFDSSGNMIEESYFDELQRPTQHKDGYFGYRAEFDSQGRLVRKEFRDARGGLTKVASLNAYGVRYEYDHFDEIVVEAHLGEDGSDLSRLEHHHNEYGWETETVYYDARNQIAARPGSGCAIERFDLDAFGRATAERCLDPDGNPVNRRDARWAVKRVAFNASGVNDEQFFDAAGRPVKPKS